MSGGCSSSSTTFTFPSSSSSSSSSRCRRSHLSFGTSYRIGGHLLQHLNLAHVSFNRNQRAIHTRVRSSIQPPPLPPLPSDPPSGHWKTWVVGTVIAVVLSFIKSRWGPLLKLKDELETVVVRADRVVEVVEKVAEQVEKAAEQVADHTPPNSKLHVAAALVEKVAKEVSKDAHIADVALDKVEEIEKEVESLVIEPIIGDATRIAKHPDA